MDMRSFFKPQIIIGILIILSIAVRLYRIDSPLADWHSWRQVDTSAVSRGFLENGFDLLHPKFHDLSNVPSGKDNPEGYRFVEFPIFNALQAGGFLILPAFNLETWGRFITVVASTLSTLFIFLIVRRHVDMTTALFSAGFFAVLPFNIYYGRSVLPDSSMVMAVLGGIYFFDLWIESSIKYKVLSIKYWSLYILTIIFVASALLLKPYAIFFMLPMVVLAWQAYGWKMVTKWQLWLFAIMAILPLIGWRMWMEQFPEGIPANAWLFNGGDIRFKGSYFYWIFADRIGRLILGYWGMGLFVLGLVVVSGANSLKKYGLFFYSFLLASLAYLIIIARGNVQHDYYQILIIPSIVIFMGAAARFLIHAPRDFGNRFVAWGLLVVCTLFSLGFGWFFVRDYYNIQNAAIFSAGKAVDRLTPPDAKIIASYVGDTTFLYYTNRKGWASMQNPLPEMVSKGATHLVLLNPTEADLELGNTYHIVEQTKEYVIFELK